MRRLQSLRNNQARQRLLAASDPIRSIRIAIVCLLVVVVDLWWQNGVLQGSRRVYIPLDLTPGLVTNRYRTSLRWTQPTTLPSLGPGALMFWSHHSPR